MQADAMTSSDKFIALTPLERGDVAGINAIGYLVNISISTGKKHFIFLICNVAMNHFIGFPAVSYCSWFVVSGYFVFRQFCFL